MDGRDEGRDAQARRPLMAVGLERSAPGGDGWCYVVIKDVRMMRSDKSDIVNGARS